MQPIQALAARAFIVALLALPVAGCGDDDGGTRPRAPTPPTHFDMTLKMSSIDVVEDCEPSGSSPGEFRWRLILRKPDEFGNDVVVHDTGYREEQIVSGDRAGVVMDEIRFRVPNDSDGQFQIEYWIGERDGSSMDFEEHSWETHRLDSGRGQMWAAGSSYEGDRYTQEPDGAGHGLYKFAVWNDGGPCRGAAYYYVTWTPVVVE